MDATVLCSFVPSTQLASIAYVCTHTMTTSVRCLKHNGTAGCSLDGQFTHGCC